MQVEKLTAREVIHWNTQTKATGMDQGKVAEGHHERPRSIGAQEAGL